MENNNLKTEQLGLQNLVKDNYCLWISGQMIGCCSPMAIETCLIFRNKKLAMEFLVVDQIPIILQGEEIGSEQKNNISILNSKYNKITDSKQDTEDFINTFNQIFTKNHKIKIEAYGYLSEFILSDFMLDLMREYKEDYDDVKKLYELITSKKIDLNKKEDVELVKNVVECMQKL